MRKKRTNADYIIKKIHVKTPNLTIKHVIAQFHTASVFSIRTTSTRRRRSRPGGSSSRPRPGSRRGLGGRRSRRRAGPGGGRATDLC